MPPLSLLIKPASGGCNVRCRYCFYRDEQQNRETFSYGFMSEETLEILIRKAMEYARGYCSFGFQGGEPTLRGLDFFRKAVELQEKYNTRHVKIANSIQTNGLLLDGEWAQFLHDHHFLVGLSLDGPADLHNLNRRDGQGKGTFNRVLRAAKLFDKHGVEYNVLCVLTGKNARSIGQIYSFYKKQGFRWLQFIPCLEPLGEEPGGERYHLSCGEYGESLIRLFDLWLRDLERGNVDVARRLLEA